MTFSQSRSVAGGTKVSGQDVTNQYSIREKNAISSSQIKDYFLDTFYLPDGMAPLPREILELPFYQKYYGNLGSQIGDVCFEAYDVLTKEIVGAVWTRIVDDDGRFDNSAPFLLIAVSSAHRGKGIGTVLLTRILSELRSLGYTKVELSVHPQNRALAFYERHGFTIYDSDTDCCQMMKYL